MAKPQAGRTLQVNVNCSKVPDGETAHDDSHTRRTSFSGYRRSVFVAGVFGCDVPDEVDVELARRAGFLWVASKLE